MPARGGHGRQGAGGFSAFRGPVRSIRDYYRWAMAAPRVAPCIVYDAAGKPVATIDPATKQRKAVS